MSPIPFIRYIYQWLRSSVGIAFLIIAIVSCTSVSHFFPENNYHRAVQMDGEGYFAYLPFIFEAQGASYQNFLDYSYQADTIPHFVRPAGDCYVNKYYAGESVMVAPFYLASKLLGPSAHEHPGYSRSNILSIAIAALFYFSGGILLLRRILRNSKFSDPVIGILLITISFGTNLWWYTAREPSMSHVYSFFLVCALLFLFQEYTSGKRGIRPLLIFICAGLLTLTRPTDVLIALFIPLFLTKQDILHLARNWPGWLSLIAIVSVQPILYFVQCGEWFVWSYADEGFHFSEPYIWSTWFSWLKGLAIYFPVLILVFPGFYFFYKKNTSTHSLWLFIGLFTLFYILSSWHAWHYGWSFGMRGYIQFYPLLLLPIGCLVEAALRRVTARIAVGLVLTYSLLHTSSVARIATIDYGFIQNITQDDWSQLLFRNEKEIRQRIEIIKAR